MIRTLTWTGTAYVLVATLALTAAATTDRHVLIGWIVAAYAVPLALGGFLAALLLRARRRLDQTRPTPLNWPAGTHGLITFVTGLTLTAALACLAQQVRDDLRLHTPVTAVLDACEPPGKAPQCSGHWTIHGRTYTSDSLTPATGHHRGDTLALLYSPTEPSYIRHPGSDIGAYGITGAITATTALAALAHHLPTEIRERRALQAALKTPRQPGPRRD